MMSRKSWSCLIVTSLLLTVVKTCAPECSLKFCDKSASFSFGKADTPLKSLCADGEPLRNIYNGPAEVLRNGRRVGLKHFKPSELSQSYSPSFFKIYSSSSMGHETVQGNQDEALLDTCVILPIFGTNKPSCVSFLVSKAALESPSPSSSYNAEVPLRTNPTTSSPEASASPSEYVFAPVRDGDTDVRAPEPSAFSLAEQTETPIPISSSTAQSAKSGSFVDLTFSEGTSKDNYLTSPIDGGSDRYRVIYDVKTISNGVVSLTNVAPEVESLTCIRSGEVRIRMKRPVWGASLADSYPIGAILALDGDEFGNCVLKTPEDKDTRFEGRLGSQQETTYLRILEVSGTLKEYTVKVKRSSFLAMFERASIEVRRVDPAIVSTSTRMSDRKTEPAEPDKIGPIVLDPLNLKFDNSYTRENFEYTGTYQVINRGTFDLFKLELLLFDVDVEVHLVEDITILVQSKFSLRPGAVSKKDVVTVGSLPIYAIPKIKLDKLWKNLPPLNLGIYLELDLFYSFNINLPTQISATFGNRYNSGKTQYVMTAKRSGLFLLPKITATRISNPSVTNDEPDIVLPDLNEEKEALAALSIGIRPVIAAYISYLKAAISIDFALSLQLDVATPLIRLPFPPLTKKAIAAPLLGVEGVCDTCHFAQLKLDGVLENSKAELLFASDDPFLEVPFSDGTPLLSFPIKVGCYVKQFGKDTQTCGRVCCDTKVGLCEFKAELKEPTCSGTPTPSPTPALPTPIPSTSAKSNGPVVFATTYTDPHLRTFDGLRYSCQGVGEFVLVQAAKSGLMVQSRFFGNATRMSASVTTALAVSAQNVPTVQIAVKNEGKLDNTKCDELDIYWNGKLRMVETLPVSSPVTISVSGRSVSVSLASGSTVSTRSQYSTTFGCYLEQVTVGLGAKDAADKSVRGLLGSPDSNDKNEWMDRSGKPIVIADGLGRVAKAAYDYCTQNWCIRDVENSIFSYVSGDSHAARNNCDAPYTPIDLSSAAPTLRRICRGNVACLIDGLATNSTEEAQRALNIEDEFEEFLGGNTSITARRASSGESFNDPIDLGDARVGSVVTFSKSVSLGSRSSVKEDLYLVTDVTSSMSGAIATVREQFDDIVRAREVASTDVAFGIGAFGDETYNTQGYKNGFKNVLAITKNLTAVREGVAGLDTAGSPLNDRNFDVEEAGLTALYQIATSPTIKWRNDARKIVAYMADNRQHEPVCLGGRVLRRQNVIAALKQKGITVIMVDIPAISFFMTGSSQANDATRSFNCTNEEPGLANQALNITADTKGTFLVSPSSAEVVEVLNQGIGNLSLTITTDTKDCEGKFGLGFTPKLPIEVQSRSHLNLQVTISVKSGACNISPQCSVKLLASQGLLAEQSILAKSIIGCA